MTDHVVEIAKGTPPVTVAALSFFGVSVPDAIQFLTLLWTAGLVVQMAYRLYRFLAAWFKARGSH